MRASIRAAPRSGSGFAAGLTTEKAKPGTSRSAPRAASVSARAIGQPPSARSSVTKSAAKKPVTAEPLVVSGCVMLFPLGPDHSGKGYHESLNNLTPYDVYFDRGQTILRERQRIKRRTIQHRRLMHPKNAAEAILQVGQILR